MIERIAAIVRADVLIRFRRLSTVVVFLLLSAFAYIWVPAPASGRALMRVAGARVINNSAAVSIGTAMLASLFIGLVGFYVVSNAIGRDVRTRCGSVIASTGVRSGEYITGKFAGNVLFLLTFTAGFMAVAMAMVVVRGEGPLEPFTFLEHYALLVPPTIALVSVLAIVFESIPFLSGRFGDVAYFFVWIVLMSATAGLVSSGVTWAEYFDFQGFAFVLAELREKLGTQSFAIGAGPFDAKLPVIILRRIDLEATTVLSRVVSSLLPLALLPVAWLAFHRFDPARVKGGTRHASGGWVARFNALLKPLTRIARIIPARGALASDVLMTFTAQPIAFVVVVTLAIVGVMAPQSLPILFAAVAVFIADVATRDRNAGAFALISAAPLLRERYVVWKLSTALVVAAVLLAAPVSRALAARPGALPAMIAGVFFIVAASVALGVISGNPKTFIVLFLSFWYLTVNDRGASPALDFAGFYVVPPMTTTLTYAAMAVALLAAAEAVHRVRLRD
ncbi:MAG: hypothetical protein WA208_13740 [Thermoanaerobaculia bacterium]